jgi:hypothetical protein
MGQLNCLLSAEGIGWGFRGLGIASDIGGP